MKFSQFIAGPSGLPLSLLGCALVLSVSSSNAAANTLAQDAPSWVEAEQGLLENHVQLTSEQRFRKAGESYFSPDDKQIIFQAVEVAATPEEEEAFYQMYVADLVRQDGRITGIENIVRLSPPGSSNTCGWFHPTEPGVVIFGSTLVAPKDPGRNGYQRESSRYSWQFPQEMDIVRCELAKADGTAATLERMIANSDAYLAECVIAPNGLSMVYCEHQVDEGTSGGDLFVLDLQTKRKVRVTGKKGYDGGPFFSPDGKSICYRSDRQGNDLLQIFVAELSFDQSGNLMGVDREFQLTNNVHVNWAPYWHPKGRHLIYATSEIGHQNYEVFMIDADSGRESGSAKYGTRRRRLTHADKFDGLPVFNSTGSQMMWTCQRGADRSSQVWVADFVADLEGDAGAVETGSASKEVIAESKPETKNAKPERMQVQDPDTGLYFLYDPKTHELSVYDPNTHKVREAVGAEIQRAMDLFNS